MQVHTYNWPEMQPVVNEFAVGGLPLTVGGWSHRGDRAGQPNGWD